MDRVAKSWQNNAVEKSADFTAVLHGVYIITATLTVTDPTPDQGHEYICHVRNGVATIGGVTYIAGQTVWRSYHSGAWSSTVQAALGTAQTWTALQTLGAGLTVSSGQVNIQTSTASTSTTTGALVVTGGIGAGGAGYFGGLVRGTQYVDAYSASNVIVGFRMYANGALAASFNANDTGGATTITTNGTTRINLPFSTSTVEIPVPTLIGSSGSVGSAPLSVAPSSWPVGVPTGDQCGMVLGRKNDGGNDYRVIGAGYFTGATNIPCIFGYQQTSSGGYTYGDFIVGTRGVTTDTAPTVRLRVKTDGTVECLATTASTSTTTGALTVAGGVGIAKEVVLTASSAGAVYWGPTGTDGSVRCYGDGAGAMIFEKRSGGSWTEIGRFG